MIPWELKYKTVKSVKCLSWLSFIKFMQGESAAKGNCIKVLDRT